mgnify:FL=1
MKTYYALLAVTILLSGCDPDPMDKANLIGPGVLVLAIALLIWMIVDLILHVLKKWRRGGDEGSRNG